MGFLPTAGAVLVFMIFGAVGKLTIADYGGDPDIKQITARIEWPEFQGTRNVTLTTLKSKY